jgi:hypothetical protein
MSNDHDLHDERISRLYRKGSFSEPPEHIDRRIRQAAEDTAPRSKPRFAWPSLATAAVLVLSVSLVFKVLDQEPLEQSLLEPYPNGTDSSIAEPKELEEATAPQADEKDDAEPTPTTAAPARVQPKPATMPPVLKDAGPARKASSKRKDTPAVEMYRSRQVLPGQSPAPGEPGSMGSSGRRSTAPGAEHRKQGQKLQIQRRSFELQAVPDDMLGAPARMKKQGLCTGVVLPDTESVADWQQFYRTAMLQGDRVAVRCLQQEFQRRFGRPLPVEEERK